MRHPARLVPVIRSAQALGLKAFSDEAKRLAGGAIDGTISPDYLSGGTFTVSNIGSFGIETFTPVINLPRRPSWASERSPRVRPWPPTERSAWSSASTCR